MDPRTTRLQRRKRLATDDGAVIAVISTNRGAHAGDVRVPAGRRFDGHTCAVGQDDSRHRTELEQRSRRIDVILDLGRWEGLNKAIRGGLILNDPNSTRGPNT